MKVLEFLNNNSGIAILVAGISTLCSLIALIISLSYNVRTQNQYKKSLEPQLSMRLDKINGMLYLKVQNTGRTAAENVKISVESIENNGANDLKLDDLFSQEHEMYPNETIQAIVAVSGENASTGFLYPKIRIGVLYRIYGTKTKVHYTRTITFSKVYDTNVIADVNIDLKNLEDSLRTTARAIVRTANYLDGKHVASYDEIEVFSEKSLQSDICSAIESTKKRK
ncbi:MAG: hypothetical protein ACC608_02250 [Anaerofustis sp.]